MALKDNNKVQMSLSYSLPNYEYLIELSPCDRVFKQTCLL